MRTPPGRLARVLEERGDLEALRARADARDQHATKRLARVLEERGDLDGLRARADARDQHAAERLARVLEERGDLDGLRARADAGDWYAASRLAGLLTKQGRREEAERLRRFGLEPDGSIASTWQAFRIKVRLRHVAGPGCGSNALPRQSRSGGCHPGRSPPAPPAPAAAQ